MTEPRAVVERPDSVTHFVCELAEEQTGSRDVTHHLVTIKNEQRCCYCLQTAGEIRREVGL